MNEHYVFNSIVFDEQQSKIVYTNSNMIIIAGAGSGKTLTLLGKISYLLNNKICSEKDILIISFTNASVNDIKLKLPFDISVLTFHKLAINILKKNSINFTICDDAYLIYIISETLINIDKKRQKDILKFVKFNGNYKKFVDSDFFLHFVYLIAKYINVFKSNDFSLQNIKDASYSHLEKRILLLIFQIYYLYIQEKNSCNKMDFDDLIIAATKLKKTNNFKYKYLIIDEFQDTSQIRLNLIKSLYHKNAKIIVVGDDWQSIYKFSGCNLNIFLNFHYYFPNTKRIHLINTYRNSAELINIASSFIRKNPAQIKKNIKSSKSLQSPIEFVKYDNPKIEFQKILDQIIPLNQSIMVLYRNNNDIYKYLNYNMKITPEFIIYKNNYIKHFTVHRSKGLEADYVLVLNCNDDILGFPNKIENHIIIQKILRETEIKYAEERRLFYVALTRCKEKVFLFYYKNKPSIFIKEIKKLIKKNKFKF